MSPRDRCDVLADLELAVGLVDEADDVDAGPDRDQLGLAGARGVAVRADEAHRLLGHRHGAPDRDRTVARPVVDCLEQRSATFLQAPFGLVLATIETACRAVRAAVTSK